MRGALWCFVKHIKFIEMEESHKNTRKKLYIMYVCSIEMKHIGELVDLEPKSEHTQIPNYYFKFDIRNMSPIGKCL